MFRHLRPQHLQSYNVDEHDPDWAGGKGVWHGGILQSIWYHYFIMVVYYLVCGNITLSWGYINEYLVTLSYHGGILLSTGNIILSWWHITEYLVTLSYCGGILPSIW